MTTITARHPVATIDLTLPPNTNTLTMNATPMAGLPTLTTTDPHNAHDLLTATTAPTTWTLTPRPDLSPDLSQEDTTLDLTLTLHPSTTLTLTGPCHTATLGALRDLTWTGQAHQVTLDGTTKATLTLSRGTITARSVGRAHLTTHIGDIDIHGGTDHHLYTHQGDIDIQATRDATIHAQAPAGRIELDPNGHTVNLNDTD